MGSEPPGTSRSQIAFDASLLRGWAMVGSTLRRNCGDRLSMPRAQKASTSGSAKRAPHADPADGADDTEVEVERQAFLDDQRALLLAERASYTRQAEELKAEADSLAFEH